MKKILPLIALVILLSSCTITVSPYWVQHPVPTIHYNLVYEGELWSTSTDFNRRLVLDFETMTYQVGGSAPQHMYYIESESRIILGEVGGYSLDIVNKTYYYIEGTWRFSTRIVDGGRFSVSLHGR
jgi:hypothetical protein